MTVYKIRNKLTKKFRVGGTTKSYTRMGKAGTNKGSFEILVDEDAKA